MRDKTATFIGHKDCYGVQEEVVRSYIIELIESGVTEFLCGGMGSFDWMCARIVYRLLEVVFGNGLIIHNLGISHIEVAKRIELTACKGMQFEIFFVGSVDAKVGISVGVGGVVDKLEAAILHSDGHTRFDRGTVFIKILHGVHLFLWVKK